MPQDVQSGDDIVICDIGGYRDKMTRQACWDKGGIVIEEDSERSARQTTRSRPAGRVKRTAKRVKATARKTAPKRAKSTAKKRPAKRAKVKAKAKRPKAAKRR